MFQYNEPRGMLDYQQVQFGSLCKSCSIPQISSHQLNDRAAKQRQYKDRYKQNNCNAMTDIWDKWILKICDVLLYFFMKRVF